MSHMPRAAVNNSLYCIRNWRSQFENLNRHAAVLVPLIFIWSLFCASCCRISVPRYGGERDLSRPKGMHTSTSSLQGQVLFISRSGAQMLSFPRVAWKSVNIGLNAPLTLHTATLRTNGDIIVHSGLFSHNDSCIPNNHLLIFNHSNMNWHVGAQVNKPRLGHASVLLDENKLLVTGGYSAKCSDGISDFDDVRTAEICDLSLGICTDSSVTNTSRSYHDAVQFQAGKILVFGGESIKGNIPSIEAEIYDYNRNTWEIAPDIHVSGKGTRAITLTNGFVVIVGRDSRHQSAIGAAMLYNPHSHTWFDISHAGLPISFAALTQIADNRIAISGGLIADNKAGTDPEVIASSKVFILDVQTMNWTSGNPLKSPRERHSANLISPSLLLVAGGYDETGNATSELLYHNIQP